MLSIHFSSQAGERPDPETRTLTRALLYFMTILILWLPGASMRALRFFQRIMFFLMKSCYFMFARRALVSISWRGTLGLRNMRSVSVER